MHFAGEKFWRASGEVEAELETATADVHADIVIGQEQAALRVRGGAAGIEEPSGRASGIGMEQLEELLLDLPELAHLKSWCGWFDANVERVGSLETVFVQHEHGYAGRVDMVAKLRGIGWAVVDFKTQKVKRSAKGEPKPVFYETWPLQLAAYQQAILANSAKDVSAIVSVVIDSAQPGPVHVRNWVEGGGLRVEGRKPEDYFGAFLSAFALWRYVKDYDPRLQAEVPATPLAA